MLKNLLILFISPLLFFQKSDFKQERALIKNSKNDSLIIDAYLKIIKGFDPNQSDSISFYFEKATIYAKDNSYRVGENFVNFTRGKYLASHGQLLNAETYLKESIKNSNPKKEKLLIANAHNTLGMVYGKKGEYGLAIKSSLTSLKIYEELKDLNGQISSYIKLGAVSRLNGDLEKALFYNEKGEQLNKKLNNPNFQLDILIQL